VFVTDPSLIVAYSHFHLSLIFVGKTRSLSWGSSTLLPSLQIIGQCGICWQWNTFKLITIRNYMQE